MSLLCEVLTYFTLQTAPLWVRAILKYYSSYITNFYTLTYYCAPCLGIFDTHVGHCAVWNKWTLFVNFRYNWNSYRTSPKKGALQIWRELLLIPLLFTFGDIEFPPYLKLKILCNISYYWLCKLRYISIRVCSKFKL